MDGHDWQLAAFLAGDLDAADVVRWDEHLLECERCWRAVRDDRSGRAAAQLLRQPAPAGLGDRVRLAVELAAAGAASWRQPRRAVRPRRRALAGAGALAAGLVVAAVVLLPGGRAALPAPVAAVARYAQTLPPPASHPERGTGRGAVPIEVGQPVTLAAGGRRIVTRKWRMGAAEVVVAVSGRPFPMPPGAQGASGGGMAWSARAGKLSLYCLNGKTSELVAAPVPPAELARLAARLPPP